MQHQISESIRMSALSLLIGIFSGWFSMGCGLDVVEFSVVEEGTIAGSAIQFPGMAGFGSSIGKGLSTQGVNPKDVDSLRILAGEIRLTSQGIIVVDLSFLESIRFEISAQDMPRTLLASRTDFPAGAKRLDLDLTPSLELKPYLDAGGLVVYVSANIKMFPPETVSLEVELKFRVDVNVL